jgi:hypothetical protein
MGRDEAMTAIEPALAPSLERRIGNHQIAPENEVTRPRIIRVARLSANSGCASCLSRGFVTGFWFCEFHLPVIRFLDKVLAKAVFSMAIRCNPGPGLCKNK